jgi:hypothetical protein
VEQIKFEENKHKEMYIPPECEKWHRTLQLFSLAIVTSETTISRKAENVENTPNLSASKPNPAAAEKLPRSMIPDGTNTSGCFWWITFRPVEPSRSPANKCYYLDNLERRETYCQ